MKKHWTERSVKDYVFRIVADFIAQLENKTELEVFNPENVDLVQMVEYARKLGMKVSIVAYEDDDPENKKGPINSEIFRVCWEKSGKPHDFWDLQEKA